MIFDKFPLHIVLQLIAVGVLLCLGWQAMSAVWSWLTTGRPPGASAAIGALVVIVVIILLAVGV